MLRLFAIFSAAVLTALTGAPAPSHSAEDKLAASILSDAVRVRGHKCDKPQNARREHRQSRPDEAVWLIDCGNATYRIRFAGDTGPAVTPMR